MFKVGDKVVCIRQSEIHTFKLNLSKTYTVRDVTRGLQLSGHLGLTYDPDRFRLISEYVSDDPTISPVIKKIRLMEKRRKQYYELPVPDSTTLSV